MSLVTTKEMFDKAYKGNYAIGAFNVDNLDGLQAVVQAAQETNSPVIIAITEKSLNYFHPVYLKHIIKAACEEASIPIALHLDHGKNFQVCKNAVDLGFTSVMIDASAHDMQTNIKLTREVVDYAHGKGIVVEAELGCIAGIEDDLSVDDKYGKFTHPNDVVEFVTKTNIDSLAIAIGTAHGAFKFKPGQVPKLRFDIVKEIEEKLPNFPLVLHGASSVPKHQLDIFNKYGGQIAEACGIPEAMLRQASSMAVCKINVGSDIRICYLGALRKALAEKPTLIDAREFITPARDSVVEMVKDKMINVLGSAGHAND